MLSPRGYELEVTFLGKPATWVLYASLGFVLVTAEGTDWPIVLLWIGVALRSEPACSTGWRVEADASREGLGSSARTSRGLKSQPEVDPSAGVLLYSVHLRGKAARWNHFPIFSTLTDDDLRMMIRDLEKEEDEISFRRRVLHGRIDILRAELVARLREQVSAGEAKLADVERLSEILTAKAAPTDDE